MIYCLTFRCRHEAIVFRVCKWSTTFIYVCQRAPATAHEYTPHILHHHKLEASPPGLVPQFYVLATSASKFDYLIHEEMLNISNLELELNV